MKALLGCLTAFLVLQALVVAASAEEQVGKQATIRWWDSATGFQSIKRRQAKPDRNISGVACAWLDRPVCLAVGDESRFVQRFTVHLRPQRGRIETEPAIFIRLAARIGKKKSRAEKVAETDFEAVAFGDGYFYVVGSFSRKRKTAALPQPRRRRLIRIPLAAVRNATPGAAEATLPTVRSLPPQLLWNAWKASTGTNKTLQKSARAGEKNCINVEGLAYQNGRLWIGFRQPVAKAAKISEERAIVYSVAADDLFEKHSTVSARVYRLPVRGGIRDIAAAGRNRFVILSGPPAGKNAADIGPHCNERHEGKYRIYFWEPSDAKVQSVQHLATLPDIAGPGEDGPMSEGKPESLLILPTGDAATLRVLILSDGIDGGKPGEIHLPRK